ncbi:MAK MRK overlapping kinase-like isoform X1 [Octopus vulgaris]|uniref:MAK MRK overlapping kinase-like isoform X1 n=1 Tax=Octopus vulgaris TaxID=6645 RepID=A0AA36B9S7_OCTVU|nr:MAK MRK overlapping kinase-like isoform X1 [Octopus vulgaris]
MNILLQKYRILGIKGEGTFSEVLKCERVKDGTLWACKKMKQSFRSYHEVNNLREIQAMRHLNPHRNILDLQEVIFDKKSGVLVLICELMDMNIYEYIRDKRSYLSERTVKNYMYQLCKSIDHIHRLGIFHRDVKPENILLKLHENLLKLADFGSCRMLSSPPPYTEYISTRWYRAPECLLTEGHYTYKMDIWSVGCVFFEIIWSRGVPYNFSDKRGTGIAKLIPHASQEAVNLIQCLCSYDQDERITAHQALKLPYFREFRDIDQVRLKSSTKMMDVSKKNICLDKDLTAALPRISEEGKNDSDSKFSVITNLPKAQSLPSHLSHHKERRKRKHKKSQENQEFLSHTGLLPQLMVHSSAVNPFSRANLQTDTSKFNAGSRLKILPNISKTTKSQKPSNGPTKNIYRNYKLAPILGAKREAAGL